MEQRCRDRKCLGEPLEGLWQALFQLDVAGVSC
jgi:hypothetical protein